MKRMLLSQMALSLAVVGVNAAPPVVEAPVKSGIPSLGLQKSPVKRAVARDNTFFEGFESRPDGFGNASDNWLPEGWSKFSKAGHTLPTDNSRHNLLWRVTDNDSKDVALVISYSAYDGDCFAHVIGDVAYVTDEGYHEPDYQDEWLVTPAFTPQDEDWLYFKLNYSPAWCTYNRDANDYSGRNTDLEVYVSTDDGANWVKMWNLIDDYVHSGYTVDELNADLINLYRDYTPMYINMKDYVGKEVKLAFRFFGRMGLGMALDNVAVGVPVPESSYSLPTGVFMQQISANCDFPANPTLLAPHGVEIKWNNTSVDFLRNEWTYEDATGAQQKSESLNLITPAYDFGSVHKTPQLQAFFESRESEVYRTNYPSMQAGGMLYGSDTSGYSGEFAVGATDVFDGSIKLSSEYMSLYPSVDLAWEKLMGYLDGTLDVLGYCSVYQKPEVPYGFDFLDVLALVKETVPADDGLEVIVMSLDEGGMPNKKIGQTVLWGSDIPAADETSYVNLRFKFPVPVYTDQAMLIVIAGCQKGGYVAFPYMVTTHPEKYGNNLIYWIHYDPELEDGYYDEFKHLGSFPLAGDRHFGGFMMGMGASYSFMERLDSEDFVMPCEGGSKEFKIKATHAPERWKLTVDGITEADWAHFKADYDAATEVYTVTLTADANNDAARTGELILASPGSQVKFNVSQPSGIADVSADNNVSVRFVNGDIVVIGGKNNARVYDITGKLVANVRLDARTVIPGDALAGGVYIVRVDDSVSFKIVK